MLGWMEITKPDNGACRTGATGQQLLLSARFSFFFSIENCAGDDHDDEHAAAF